MWDVTKKAINSDLSEPLNELVSGEFWAKMPNSGGLVPSASNNVIFSPDSKYMVLVKSYTVDISKCSEDGFVSLPVLEGLPAADGLGSIGGVAFSADNELMAIVFRSSRSIFLYKRSGDGFTRLPDPPLINSASSNHGGIAFSPDNELMVVVYQNSIGSSFAMVYKRSGDSFSVLATNQLTQGGEGFNSLRPEGVVFSPDGELMVVWFAAGTAAMVYRRSGDSFTYTQMAGSGLGLTSVVFSPDGELMAVTQSTAPFVMLYKRSGDRFSLIGTTAESALTGLPLNGAVGVAFSADSKFLAVAFNIAKPAIAIFKRSGDRFALVSNALAGLPAIRSSYPASKAAFSLDGRFLAVSHNVTEGLTLYSVSKVKTIDLLVDLYNALWVMST